MEKYADFALFDRHDSFFFKMAANKDKMQKPGKVNMLNIAGYQHPSCLDIKCKHKGI